MTPSVWRSLTAALVLCLAPGLAYAKAKEGDDRTAPDIDQRTGAKLNQAIEQLNAEHYAEARAVLGKLNFERLSPYERARVEHLLSAIAQSEGNYDEAGEHLRLAIESGGMNEQEAMTARYQIAELLIAREHWKEGIAALKAWFASGAVANSAAYYLLAVCHFQLKEYDAALEPAQKAVSLSDKPTESWLVLLLALRIQREEYALAAPLLKRLVALAPQKKSYWVQLSNVNATLEKYEEAIAPLQLAYAGGLLTEPGEYRRLVDLLMHENIPYRAAVILSKAVDEKSFAAEPRDFEKLSSCWIAAREYEKAVAPLGRAAAAASTGELYQRLAELQRLREDWKGVATALDHAFEKGSMKNIEEAQLLMGIALDGQKRRKEAREWFKKALASPKTKTQAEGWIRYLDAGATN